MGKPRVPAPAFAFHDHAVDEERMPEERLRLLDGAPPQRLAHPAAADGTILVEHRLHDLHAEAEIGAQCL